MLTVPYILLEVNILLYLCNINYKILFFNAFMFVGFLGI